MRILIRSKTFSYTRPPPQFSCAFFLSICKCACVYKGSPDSSIYTKYAHIHTLCHTCVHLYHTHIQMYTISLCYVGKLMRVDGPVLFCFAGDLDRVELNTRDRDACLYCLCMCECVYIFVYMYVHIRLSVVSWSRPPRFGFCVVNMHTYISRICVLLVSVYG